MRVGIHKLEEIDHRPDGRVRAPAQPVDAFAGRAEPFVEVTAEIGTAFW
jgi:hypothetical protein